MQRNHRHGPRRFRHRKKGFSRPISKQWYEMLGIPREQKRAYFNMLAKCVVISSGITGAAFGLTTFGIVGAIVLGFAATGFGVWFVKQDRMFR